MPSLSAAPIIAPLATALSHFPELAGAQPVFGHMLHIRADPLNFHLRGMREHPRGFAFRFGPHHAISVFDPEIIRAVLVEKADAFEKGFFGNSLVPLVGRGLLTAGTNPHKRQRQLVAPAFHHHRVLAYGEAMARYALERTGGWRDGAIIDVSGEMMALTLRIVGKTLFDADVASEAGKVGAALTVALEFITRRQLSLVQLPLTWPLPMHQRFQDAVAQLDHTIFGLIAERRANGVDHGDLLSMLLAARDEAGGGFDDAQVRDEAMTIFLAGHETTANALSWALHLLMCRPKAWGALREEVVGALQGRSPTVHDLPKLTFTLQVLKEALRLYPPAYIFGRQAIRDVTLAGIPIPKDTIVTVSTHALHRNPTVFSDPEAFRPERFTPEAEARLPKFAYLPFGGGARVCIGNQFALMEGQLILATIAQHARFEPMQDHVELDPQVTLRPKGGVVARVRRL